MTTSETPVTTGPLEQELPDYLPQDPAQFYAAGVDSMPPQAAIPDEQQVLERLGPPPFPKSKFPFVGFLAGVYEHVRTRSGERLAVVEASPSDNEIVSENGEFHEAQA